MLGRFPTLAGADLDVESGEVVLLSGPNGAGKTTLLKMLATLLLPNRGRIAIDGCDVVKDPIGAKRRIGLCTSEERSFYFRLTARSNMEYFGALVGLRGVNLQRRVCEVAEIVGLGDQLDKRFDAFSSGMRQRLTVARALLADPPVLFFDEPTRAVDPVNADAIRTLIRDELVGRRGKTVVLATNLLDEAWSLCDRIAVVNRGTIVALDTPEALTAEFHTVARYHIRIASEDTRIVDRIVAINGIQGFSSKGTRLNLEIDLEIEPSEDSFRELMRCLADPLVRLHEMTSIAPEPMDVFKHVTAGTS